MDAQTVRRSILPMLGAGALLLATAPSSRATQHFEKHFPVKGHPVVCIHNIGNGRIEVKSSKNSEVVVAGTQASSKVTLETEVNFQLTVPEDTELELKTQTGLIYVEQVMGDMTLQSVAGDVHLKEVSGYIVVRTMHGSLICAQCAGKLDFNSVSGNAQLLQPGLTSVNLFTTSGNILFDGDFIRTGL